MKVLQINTVCGFGSTGRIATDLYEVLEECSIEEIHTALAEVAKTDLFIFRFNVLPREVFSALY